MGSLLCRSSSDCDVTFTTSFRPKGHGAPATNTALAPRTTGRSANRHPPEIFCSCRLALLHQPVEMKADMGRLRRRMGKRDGLIECHPRLVAAAELQQQPALDAVEVEIAGQRLGEWLDHGERRRRSP